MTKNIKDMNTDEAFLSMFQQNTVDTNIEEAPDDDVAMPPTKKKKTSPSPTIETKETLDEEKPKKIEKKKAKKEEKICIHPYISKEINKALKRKIYLDDNANISSIVNEALEIYLKEDLEAIRNGKI